LSSRSFRSRQLKSRFFERALAMLFDQSRRRAVQSKHFPKPVRRFCRQGGHAAVSR
jgi:hypothetical protein